MKVADVMNPKVDRISADASVEDAARAMASLGADVLAVGKGCALCGSLSCRDIVMNVTARGGNPKGTKVGQAMTHGLAFCFDDQDVDVPVAMMRDRVEHVLVLDDRHQLVGSVSMHDLAARRGAEVLAVQLARECYQISGLIGRSPEGLRGRSPMGSRGL